MFKEFCVQFAQTHFLGELTIDEQGNYVTEWLVPDNGITKLFFQDFRFVFTYWGGQIKIDLKWRMIDTLAAGSTTIFVPFVDPFVES